MSIWKSPVFYFGVVLLLAVTGALVAPFVVDWNTYKSDLEAYGERLSGRNVQINGPVNVRLFPFPRLEAEFVDLGNSDDPAKGTFAAAEKVVLRVALDGLFAGELRIEEITFEKPVFDLERRRDGSVNWIMQPQESLKNSPLLDQVRLDRIALKNATIRVLDEQRLFKIAFEDVNAVLSAQQITGPWRSEGVGTVLGQRADFVLTTTAYVDTEPLRVGLKIAPQDKTWPNLAIDAAIEKNEAKGKLRLEPTLVEGAKGNLEGRFRPLKLQADLAARSDAAELTNIRITPADSSDSSTLIEGEVKAVLTDRVTADATFNAARLNLDTVFGGEFMMIWRAAGLLGLVDQMIAQFPERLDLKLEVQSDALTVASQTLENIEVSAEVTTGNARLRRISANLPGRSRLLADGITFTGENGAEFGGKVALESNDLRLFTGWLWPESKSWITKHWTGNRGQLKLQGNVDWSNRRLALKDVDFELNGAAGRARVTHEQSDTSTLALEGQITSLDVDAFLPKGVSVNGADSQLAWSDVLRAAMAGGAGGNTRLLLVADDLTLNSVAAQDVSLSADVTAGNMALNSFSIGSVGSAQLTAQGRVQESDGSFEGELTAGLSAEDPNRFLRLIGIGSATELAPWQKQLGKTDATAKLILQKGENEPLVTVSADAKSGALSLSSTAELSSFESPDGMRAKGTSEIASPDGTQLLRLFGLEPQPVAAVPGKLTLSFDGQPKSGYAVESKLEALAATTGFSGTYQPGSAGLPALRGKLSVAADDPRMAFQAIGIPAEPAAGKLRIDMELKPQLESMLLEDISGEIGGVDFSGKASATANGVITADFSGGALTLSNAAALSLMQWLGSPSILDSNFNPTAPWGVNGEVWLRPDSFALAPDISVKEAVVGLQFEQGKRLMSIAGRSPEGDPLSLDLTVTPTGEQHTLTVTGSIPIDLAKVVRAEDGSTIVQGKGTVAFKASGNGLSPAAAIADATGSGTLEVSGASVSKFAPAAFAERIRAVKSADDLRIAFNSLRQGMDFVLPDQSVPFAIASGRLTADPVTTKAGTAAITINAEADLVEQTLAATLQLKVPEPAGLPAVNLQVAGLPSALRQRLETSELAGKLGYDIMAREMAELERVQAEQQRALEEEKEQALQDEQRYQAYLEQRAELRLRQRELKVHATQRAREAQQATASLEARLEEFAAMTKPELARRTRETRILNSLANGGGVSKPVKSKRIAREPSVTEDLPQGFELPSELFQPQP
jgi:uncharacterized protein involved in outer membrane biogenesis